MVLYFYRYFIGFWICIYLVLCLGAACQQHAGYKFNKQINKNKSVPPLSWCQETLDGSSWRNFSPIFSLCPMARALRIFLTKEAPSIFHMGRHSQGIGGGTCTPMCSNFQVHYKPSTPGTSVMLKTAAIGKEKPFCDSTLMAARNHLPQKDQGKKGFCFVFQVLCCLRK